MYEKLYTIYAIQCTVNKKIYIGATRQDLKNRLRTHLALLRHDKHSNKLLQEDFSKYGEDKFIFYELETGVPYKSKDRERYYMDKYKSYMNEYGYNAMDNYYKKAHTIDIIKGQPEIEAK